MMQPDFDDTASVTSAPSYGKRLLWFVLLWCAGLTVTLLVTLPFKLLIHAVAR